jgi:hypothetical protein
LMSAALRPPFLSVPTTALYRLMPWPASPEHRPQPRNKSHQPDSTTQQPAGPCRLAGPPRGAPPHGQAPCPPARHAAAAAGRQGVALVARAGPVHSQTFLPPPPVALGGEPARRASLGPAGPWALLPCGAAWLWAVVIYCPLLPPVSPRPFPYLTPSRLHTEAPAGLMRAAAPKVRPAGRWAGGSAGRHKQGLSSAGAAGPQAASRSATGLGRINLAHMKPLSHLYQQSAHGCGLAVYLQADRPAFWLRRTAATGGRRPSLAV